MSVHSDNYWLEQMASGKTPDGEAVLKERPSVNGYPDELDTILFKDYPTAQILYKDDFSNGSLNGWREQFDSSSPGRVGITLTDEARLGAYALLLHTRAANSDEAWMRKGFSVPTTVKKVIKGCYWMIHGENTNTPGWFQLDFDYQKGNGSNNMASGSPSGSDRRYWSVRWLNYSGGLVQKLQVNTGTPTAQSWTDVPGGYMPIGWNESEKPLLNYMAVVFNVETDKYEKVYMNGKEFDISALAPTAGANLLNYDMGAIDINIMGNRTDSPTEAQAQVERPFLAYVY